MEGSGSLRVMLSAGERQSKELMRKVHGFARVYETSVKAVEGRWRADDGTTYSTMEVILPNKSRIIGLPANPDTARGYSADVDLDEYSVHRDSTEIWRAMYPTVTRGFEVCVGGTPKGKLNQFYKLASHGPPWKVDKVTIHDAVRAGLKVDVEELRAGLGDDEAWRQEFLCEFVDEATAFLTWEMILACEHEQATTELPGEFVPQGNIYVGWDVARWNDLSVLWVFERLGDVLWTRAVIEMRRVPFSEQLATLEFYMVKLNAARVAIDATGMGEMPAEVATDRWGEHRVDSVKFTAGSKATLAGTLRLKIEDKLMRIPPVERIRQDFHCIRKTTTATGNTRFDGQIAGSHADRFWAAALGVEAANEPSSVPGVYVL